MQKNLSQSPPSSPPPFTFSPSRASLKVAKSFSFPLVILTVIFCTCLIVANIIAGKMWATPLSGVLLTAGVFCFPLVYIIVDVVPEVYGFAVARRVIALGFFANLLAVVFFLIAIKVPYPPFFTGQSAFEIVLGFTPRLLVASFVGYLIGTNINAWILTAIKKLTGARLLWVRTILSTLVGETVDSALFMLIAFWGVLPANVIPGMIVAQTLFKSAYEAIATPVTYVVVNYFKKLEGVDQYANATDRATLDVSNSAYVYDKPRSRS